MAPGGTGTEGALGQSPGDGATFANTSSGVSQEPGPVPPPCRAPWWEKSPRCSRSNHGTGCQGPSLSEPKVWCGTEEAGGACCRARAEEMGNFPGLVPSHQEEPHHPALLDDPRDPARCWAGGRRGFHARCLPKLGVTPIWGSPQSPWQMHWEESYAGTEGSRPSSCDSLSS